MKHIFLVTGKSGSGRETLLRDFNRRNICGNSFKHNIEIKDLRMIDDIKNINFIEVLDNYNLLLINIKDADYLIDLFQSSIDYNLISIFIKVSNDVVNKRYKRYNQEDVSINGGEYDFIIDNNDTDISNAAQQFYDLIDFHLQNYWNIEKSILLNCHIKED